jgi:hypothetical protein
MYRLNDSINAKFQKIDEKQFLLGIYFRHTLKCKLICLYEGRERKDTVNILVSKGGKRYFEKTPRVVRGLELQDSTCLAILPKNLLY